MGFEKRKYPRASLLTEVWLGQEGIFTRLPRTLRDLSEEGALIETTDGFPVGSVLNIRFMLPDATHLISCAASVRHFRDAAIGVQFLDISQEDQMLVSAFVDVRNTSPTV